VARATGIRKGMTVRFTPFIIAAVAVQCIATLIVMNRISFFIGDDLNAVELLQQTGFLTFITTSVDVHLVPLHRLVNYVLHSLWPLNFTAATIFMTGCHAASAWALYRLLQRLNPSRFNTVLLLMFALNGYVIILMHWWSAGLHRLPYILLSIISCHGFVRFHEQRRARFAVLALLCQVAAAGFFIKAILIPACWAGLLFCLVDFRQWKNYRHELLLVAAGLMLSLAYVGFYAMANPDDMIAGGNRGEVMRAGLLAGTSITGHMLLQMPVSHATLPWVNAGLGTLLLAAVIYARRSWRAVLAGVALVLVNLAMILMSSRATFYGALIIFIPYYYAELMFVIALFASLAWREIVTAMQARRATRGTVRKAGSGRAALHPALAIVTLVACAGYALAGWHTAMLALKPGPDEDHWRSAQFMRNLQQDMANTSAQQLNLLDTLLPSHFRFGTLFRKPLPASMFLSWHGWQLRQPSPELPLHFIDADGHIRTVVPRSAPQLLRAHDAAPDGDCPATASGELLPDTALPLERGYVLIDYRSTGDAQVNAEILTDHGTLPVSAIHLPASANRVLLDLSRLGVSAPIALTGLRIVHGDAAPCLRSVSITPY
jgi:hypothetical protein